MKLVLFSVYSWEPFLLFSSGFFVYGSLNSRGSKLFPVLSQKFVKQQTTLPGNFFV